MASRVLIVDDDHQARALASVLERGGYEVAVAWDAQGAIAVLQDRPVDAVLSAWMLVGDDGARLIRRIRATVRPCPPILMLGTMDGQEIFQAAFRAGADDYLVQPVEPAHLLARVARCIDRYTRAHDLQNVAKPSRSEEDELTQRRRAAVRRTARLGSQVQVPESVVPSAVAVGLCAGVGGGAAIDGVLAQLLSPSVRHAAFVAVVHDPAWHHPDPCERLERQLNMSVNWASDGASLAPGSLHLAPLGRGHVVANGPPFGLSLVPPPPQGGICPSADWLFRSLSVGFGRFTISVVLAGVGTDGAIGVDLTVRGGGVGLVQEPADSQGGDMARAVLKRVPNVRRIPIATLGETLSRYIRELSRQLAQARDGSVG